MKNSKLTSLFCIAILALVIVSCKKKKQTEQASEIAKQNAFAESIFNDAHFMAAEAARGPEAFDNFGADCTALTYDTTGNQVTITIDYGTEDCLCADGKNRRGKLMISYKGPIYHSVGNVITHSTENYYVNGSKIEGTRKMTITEDDVYQIESSATITLANDGGEMTWTSSRTRTRTAGSKTFVLNDDEFTVVGTASGRSAVGKDFTVAIAKPLSVQMGCRWIKAGTLEIESAGLEGKATIDYGTGSCDNFANLTYLNKSREINL